MCILHSLPQCVQQRQEVVVALQAESPGPAIDLTICTTESQIMHRGIFRKYNFLAAMNIGIYYQTANTVKMKSVPKFPGARYHDRLQRYWTNKVWGRVSPMAEAFLVYVLGGAGVINGQEVEYCQL